MVSKFGNSDKSARFWDRIAERYSRRPVADEAAYQEKLRITREHLRPEMEVLELGCGTGSTAISHAPFVKHIRAVDISANMLEIAQRKADAAGIKNVTFEQSPIDALRVSDQSIDAVLALSILHLLEDGEAVMARVYRMLKPGGIFVSSTMCLGDGMSYFKPILAVGRFFGRLPLVKFFGRRDLEDNLAAAGFVIDHAWQPSKRKAVFIVARKADSRGG